VQEIGDCAHDGEQDRDRYRVTDEIGTFAVLCVVRGHVLNPVVVVFR
jgi:hypothetical protein